MYALGLLGCGEALVPEVVLPGDVPVETVGGAPYSELGASVGWGPALTAAGPRAGLYLLGDELLAVDARWAGFWGEEPVYATVDGVVHVRGVPTWDAGESTIFAAGAGGVVATDGTTLHLLDRGRSVEIPGITALAVGTDRVLGVRCAEGCVAEAWSYFGVSLGELGEAGEGSGIGEVDGVAWWGEPAFDVPDGAGRARAEDGREVVGEPGDHLGVAIGGGYAGGVFNKWLVPARGRLVPLEAGPTYALERGAEDQPVALAGDDTTLVVGSPFYPLGSEPAGVVLVVAR